MSAGTPRSAQSSRPYLDFDQFIDAQVERARNGIRWAEVLTAAVGLAVLVLAYLCAFVVLDHWAVEGGFSPMWRGVLLGVVGVAAAAWIGWKVVRPSLRRINRLYAAEQIERHDPTMMGGLLNLIDAGESANSEAKTAMRKRAAAALAKGDVDDAVDRTALVKFSFALLALVVFACGYAVLSPKAIGSSLGRALLPGADIAAVTRTRIVRVDPGEAVLLAGETLPVEAVLGGELPDADAVFLTYTTPDGRATDEIVPLRRTDPDGVVYAATLAGPLGRGLTTALSYTVFAGDAEAGPFAVTVDPAPHAEVNAVAVEPPDYTRLPDFTQSDAALEVVEGTRVSWTATSSLPVARAQIAFADDAGFDEPAEVAALAVGEDGVTLTGSTTLRLRPDGTAPAFYRVEVTDADGRRDPRPTVHPVTVEPDEKPEVELKDPSEDLTKPANATVPLRVVARDPDFRMKTLTLRREKNGEPIPGGRPVWDGDRRSVEATHDWDLSDDRAEPGDVFAFWIEARDDRRPHFNVRQTPKLTLTVTAPVTGEEAARQLEADRDRQDDQRAEEREENAEGQPDQSEQGEPQDEDAGESGDEGDPEAGGEQGEGEEQTADAGETGDAEDGGESGDTQPGGDTGEGERSDAGEGGEERQDGDAGDGDSVADDGTEDDEALQKLLDRLGDNPPEQGDQQQSGDDGEQGSDQQAPGEHRPGDAPQDDGSAVDQSPDQSGDEGERGDQPPGEQDPDGQPGSDAAGEDAGTDAGESDPGDAGQSGGSGDQQQPTDADTAGGDRGPGEEPGGPQNPGDGTDQAGDRGEGDPAGSDPAPGDARGGERAPGDADAPDQRAGENEDMTGAERNAGDPADAADAPPGEGERPADAEPQPGGPGDAPDADAPPDAQPPRGDGQDGNDDRPSDRGETGKGKGNDEGSKPKPNSSPQSDPSAKPGEEETGDRDSAGGDSGEQGGAQDAARGDRQSETPGGDGQQSKQPGGDQPGDQPSPDGEGRRPGEGDQPGGEQPGGKEGEQGDQPKPGDGQQPGQGEQPGQSGDPGEGRQPGRQGEQPGQGGQPGEGQPPGEGGQPGQGQPPGGGGQPGEGDQSGQGQPSGGQPGQPGQGGGNESGPGGDGTPGGGSGGAADSSAPANEPQAADAADLDAAKRGAELALNKLRDQLDRDDVDPELLKELGWTEDQLERFADRLEEQLAADPAADPREAARQKQFEETLKALGRRQRAGNLRSGADIEGEDPGGVGPRDLPVPPEYEELYRAFRRSVAGEGRRE